MLIADHTFHPSQQKKNSINVRNSLSPKGRKKADALTHHSFPCIGLSGVYGWKDKRIGESKPLSELEEFNWKNK